MQTPVTDPRALAAQLAGYHSIGGELTLASSGQTFPVINPATAEVIAQAAAGDASDIDRAVAAASRAQPEWAARKARDRGKLVAECGHRLAAHAEELGLLTALETGKALRTESRVEASVLADVFVYYGGLASELKGESVPFNPDMLTVTVRQPIGVVGAIIPWNAPLLLMALKIAPALVAGNTVVVKSAEEAPLGVLRIAQIASEILPPGVLNVLSGDGPTAGAPLAAHPDIGKLTFTGSVETGRIVYRAAAEKLIPVTLELGGKSPMIAMADADLDRAVQGAIGGMRFTRQGQSCTAASRILVHRSIHDEFVTRMVAAVNKLVMGDPLDDATDIGTIISPDQLARVNHYIELGDAATKEIDGAAVHVCCELPADPRLERGLFVQPRIYTGVPHDHALNREEVFGPVTCVHAFDDYEQAIALANDCDYGLAATIWTRDLATAMDAVHRLEAGFVQVNQNLVVQPMLSYGGIKQSGIGKEGSLQAMLEHFTEAKTIIINMR